jgi:transcriptional regulator with XRE-family HTH domain
MSADIPQIGDIVRRAREAIGLSQADLARNILVSKQTANALEKDRWLPKFERFYRLVHALNVSADLFIYPDRVPYTPERADFHREMLTCNEYERESLLTYLRVLRHDVSEKQG